MSGKELRQRACREAWSRRLLNPCRLLSLEAVGLTETKRRNPGQQQSTVDEGQHPLTYTLTLWCSQTVALWIQWPPLEPKRSQALQELTQRLANSLREQ